MFHFFHLSFCKAIHGKLSKEYFFLVQKYREKYPNLKIRLKKCISSEGVLKFENLIVRNNRMPVYKTVQTIQFEKTDFGSDIKEIVRNKGEINCTNYFQVEKNVFKIIGYKEQILNAPAILLFFLCDGKYFMGEYIFSENVKSISGQLVKTIFKRYGIEAQNDEPQFYVEDEQGSVLCVFDNGFSLSIKYFNSVFCHSLENLQTLYKRKFSDNQQQFPGAQGYTSENKF